MKKVMGSVMVAGALLSVGADFAGDAKIAVDATGAPDVWAQTTADFDARVLAELAAVGTGSAGPSVSVGAHDQTVMVGVRHEFSTWSDVSAVFRPSRWRNPFRQGGSLSWMNYKAWGAAPGRTGKVLLGEAIILGAGYAVYEATDDDDNSDRHDGTASGTSGDGTTTLPPSGGGGSTGGGSSSGGSSSGGSSSGGSSSGGSSSGGSSSGELPF